jgi:hypothetical protein
VLPFFPDFVLIDDFKDEICACLEDYNQHIELLKTDMDEATHNADLIRADIRSLRNRCVWRREVAGRVLTRRQVRLCGRGAEVRAVLSGGADAAVLPVPVPARLPRRLPDC